MHKCFNSKGRKGKEGPTGPTGPAGIGLGITGSCYSDYIYWDSDRSEWSIGSNNIHIGCDAGYTGQGSNTIAVGYGAGYDNQGPYAIAQGYYAGYTGQGNYANAQGYRAGHENQGYSAIAQGYSAGLKNQGDYAIAQGYYAGYTGQGNYAIALGYQAGYLNQPPESIVLNASTVAVNGSQSGALYINHIRSQTNFAGPTGHLYYNPANYEVFYDTAKPFVIPHPNNPNKYLVHACLEGPEAGIYYRGKSEIISDHITITLPTYVATIGTDFTITLTAIGKFNPLYASEISDNKFTVYGEQGKFHWHVYGKRAQLEVEPDKNNYKLNRMGPYTWLEK